MNEALQKAVLIPCRGGSKGIPRKNLQFVGGVNLVARAVRTALQANIDVVAVSTDDQEISDIARSEGAHVINRPSHLATDKASSDPVLIHGIKSMIDDKLIDERSLVGLVQATSPLVDYRSLSRAFKRCLIENVTIIATRDWHGFLWEAGESLSPIDHVPEARLRRQDLPKQRLLECGAFYVARASHFLETQNRFGYAVKGENITLRESIEVDDFHELRLVNSLSYPIMRPFPEGIKLVVTDFDGVMTNNLVLVSSTGESAHINRYDGEGISGLTKLDIKVCILTREQSPSPAFYRADKLGIKAYSSQRFENKAMALYAIAQEHGALMSEVIFIGNSILDIEAMRTAAFSFSPADSHQTALHWSDMILPCRGGDGVLLRVYELLNRRDSHDQENL
jgi:YrbI family 3-deoxy-D-manno-octulosonate 8-phosphate phosphatase